MGSIKDESDLLKVVNRSRSYEVSKKLLCSSIPYFEKMFCCDLLESRENKVTLDLDESGFHNILSYIYSNVASLHIGNVLQTYDCCEYLMFDELKKRCSDFFFESFNLDHLSTIFHAIGPQSKLITPEIINSFIRRHFLKISRTKAFIHLPIAMIEYILNLEIDLDSEYQAFDAIRRWVKYKKDQDENVTRLLKFIRWCNLDPDDLEKIKKDPLMAKVDLQEIICSPGQCVCNCVSNRVRIRKPILIFRVDDSTIEIVLYDVPGFCYPCGHFKLDESLSVELFTDEHITDILYQNGSKCIRVDWKEKKYRYLVMWGSENAYYTQIYRYIIYSNQTLDNFRKWTLTEPVKKVEYDTFNAIDIQIEYDGYYISIGPDKDDENELYLLSPVAHKSWFYAKLKPHARHACVMKDSIYLIKKDLSTVMANLITQDVEKSKLREELGFKFEDIALFSSSDSLFIYQKSTHKIYSYDPLESKWSFIVEFVTPHTLLTVSSIYQTSDDVQFLFRVR